MSQPAAPDANAQHPILELALGCLSQGEKGKEPYALLPAGAAKLKAALVKTMGTPEFQPAMRALVMLGLTLDTALASKNCSLALFAVTQAVAQDAIAKGLVQKPPAPKADVFATPTRR